ncbi:RNA 3'-terminal phosphate cyclase-like protein [Chelonia mydas]|uniref:RNA 3'-terminal phosphate cyclase-like protein n=1 Tax=Chelonia mydas TaxID=8469 RepID=M7B0B5_CHEMY|nr:RNA 3'-terminal phosphate cyclase-like protein [Chelonia mydas]
MASQPHSLSYVGCNFLRQRLVLSTLSGRPVKIRKIRAKEENPGLRDFEASFIRLIDKVTNGSRIEINQTGTTLYYQPGLLSGGVLEHDCSPHRSIGYYLESLLCLAPFMKHPLRIVLRGVTNDQVDPSDYTDAKIKPTVHLKQRTCNTNSVTVAKALYIIYSAAVQLQASLQKGSSLIVQKEANKNTSSNGSLNLTTVAMNCVSDSSVLNLKTVVLLRKRDNEKRNAPQRRYSVRVSPQIANRIVDSARSILNKFIPDIYIYTDHMKGTSSGKSPGFGLSLVAETTNGTFLGAELASNPQGQGTAVLPEELGLNCAKLLLEEIYRGGCVDSTNQSLVLLLMTLGQPDVSKVLLGPLSPYTIEFLRHLRSFFQIMFKIETKPSHEELQGGEKVLMTCVGIGFSNLSKTIK